MTRRAHTVVFTGEPKNTGWWGDSSRALAVYDHPKAAPIMVNKTNPLTESKTFTVRNRNPLFMQDSLVLIVVVRSKVCI